MKPADSRRNTVSRGQPTANLVHVSVNDTIRLGFIGCGNRGTGACREALSTAAPVKLVAMGDVLPDRLETSLYNLTKYADLKAKIDVPEERKFIGFDAYQRVLQADVDAVLLTTPPQFRPLHYAAAIRSGKHVFMEKPCCIDAPGYRLLLATNEQARRRRLVVVVGMQRRHQRLYRDGVQRIRDGLIGRVQLIRTYFNVSSGGRAGNLRPPGMSELEYQLRYWGIFCWLSGDHLVEQATHEIDVANWVMEGHPIRANGMGGRQVRYGVGNGDIWDHHMVEFEYANGVRYYCQARQQPGTWNEVSDNFHGQRGVLQLGQGVWGLGEVTPRTMRSREYRGDNPYQQEHHDWMASIRGESPYRCEGDYGADSSMTAVMGRMATYCGKLVTWEEATRSELRLGPERCDWDVRPPTERAADGGYVAAAPGITRAL